VVAGRAVVTLDGTDHELHAGQAVDIPVGTAHRVSNPGDAPLVFVEVQQGDYFGEDDIVRLEDDYGRADQRP
jgi:mannose-6-phosphate isomerase